MPALDEELEAPSVQGSAVELSEEEQAAGLGLGKKFSTRELKDRRFEIRRARKARFFWRGIQHLVWNDDASMFIQGPLGSLGNAAATSAEMPTFVRDFNIYNPYGKAFCATFCQNQPATRFEPDDPAESIDIEAAEAANNYRRVFEKWNPPRILQNELARLFWTDDRVVSWTRHVKDGQRFGYEQDQKTERGREITTLHGVLEHKCPITIKDPHDMCYQKISVDLDVATIKGRFPEIADKIQEGAQGTMDDAYARNARIATAEGSPALSQGGDALAHLGTIDYLWLRPDAFHLMEDLYRDSFTQKFPKGVRLAYVGDVFAEAEAVSMDDELTIFHATAGDGQNRNGMGDWLIAVQEEFNNLMNMSSEYYRYGIPEEWIDSEIHDIESDQDRAAAPGGRRTFKGRSKGEPADNSFHISPASVPPPELAEFIQFLQGPFAQFVSGQQAAIFGKSDQHNETAKGIELLRDQALGLVSLVWMPFTIGWANVIHQAVKAARKNPRKISTLVAVPGKKGKSEQIDIDADDMRGNVLASPETDENFPESWTSKSNKIMQLAMDAEKNPVTAKIMALPANMQLTKMALGLDDLVVPGQASNDKQLAEIEELMLTGPIEVDPMTGQPVPPQPSIPIDPVFDDSAAEWEAGLVWVNSADGGQKAAKDNPAGFQNVKLHLMQHKQVNDAQQAQQLQQQIALKHPSAPIDPNAQAAKQELLKDAADAVRQLDIIAHLPVAATMGNVQGQVAAAKAILDGGVKVSTTQ